MLSAMWHVLLELAPWLLIGAIVAGLLHVALPRNFVRRQLEGRWAVLKAVLLGVPLPLCSCGVIPAGLGLKKDGASHGATVGFLISTPQTGVDSVLVSASFLGWPFAVFKVLSAALTGIVGGYAADAATANQSVGIVVGDEPADGGRRGLRAFANHALEILETIWHWLVFGIVASAAIEVFVPDGFLEGLAAYGGLAAMLVTLVIALPLYVCATASVPIAAALVAGGLPPGAALVFLMAGPATNVATIGSIYRALGARSLAVYLVTIIVGSVGLGLAFDFVLQGTAVSAVHDHHATAWWAVVAAVVLLGLLGYFALRDTSRWVRRKLAPTPQADSIEVGVDGMTCKSCVARLERTLTSDDQVEAAQVHLEDGRAVVSGNISEARIRELVERAGFTPRAPQA